MDQDLPFSTTLEVRDRCLCLHLQRAGRAIGRQFDDALRPVGLSNGQYSLLMALNRPAPPRMQEVAATLAMDRTTLTANLKPLQKRGYLTVEVDPDDRRGRLVALTDAGRDILKKAVPIWRSKHDEIDTLLTDMEPGELVGQLMALSRA